MCVKCSTYMCQLTCFLQRNHISHSEHVFNLYITIHISLCVSLALAQYLFYIHVWSGVNAPYIGHPVSEKGTVGLKASIYSDGGALKIHFQYIFYINTFHHLCRSKSSVSQLQKMEF